MDRWVGESVTGVCAYNDETAMAVLAGMNQRGLRSPDDLAVIGVGDLPAAQVSIPPLSTIAFDYAQTGRDLARVVTDTLDGGSPTPHGSISSPRLVRRASAP